MAQAVLVLTIHPWGRDRSQRKMFGRKAELTTNFPLDASKRAQILMQRRERKMARSLYCYLRGDIAAFYRHLGELAVQLPQGPEIWISGDCHLGNLGALSDGNGEVEVHMRDFDQAVIGNPSLDLLRLALSMASVVSNSGSGEKVLQVVAGAVEGYAAGLALQHGAADEPAGVEGLRRRAGRRKWRHVAKERLGHPTPGIVLGKRFWPLLPPESADIRQLIADPGLAHHLFGEAADEGIEMIDAAYWVKGCSSLGSLRYAVTVRCGSRFHLVDIKQAVSPLAEQARSLSLPLNDAERIVAGARALSPRLGLRMSAAEVSGRPVFARTLSPNDLKLEADLMMDKDAGAVAYYLGTVVGRSHGAQLTLADRLTWAGVVADGIGETAFWLFKAVVRMLGQIEIDYLAHCRRLQTSADSKQHNA